MFPYFPPIPPYGNGNMFPYTNFHEMNLDWIIKVLQNFISQYNHLEETIQNGETSINTLTQQKLAQLNTEANNLLTLLTNTYNNYNAEITADVQSAITEFQTMAQQIAEHTAQTIPQDYSALSASVVSLSTSSAFTSKLLNLEDDYDIIPMTFTNLGGISSGNPYDVTPPSQRFRTTNGYPFPVGSFLVIPDGLVSNFEVWCTYYWDSGRYKQSVFGDDPKRLDSFTPTSFSSQTEDLYLAISGKTITNSNITSDMITELNNTVKIAIPKTKQSDERLSGDVTGAKNLFTGVPFQYGRSEYFYETWGNTIKEVSEDYRTWDKSHADFAITLPRGTYHVQCKFISNDGSNPDAVAFKVFNSAGQALIDYGGRETWLFNNPVPFTLNDTETVYLQWKTYIGVKFSLYLFSENYMTLKMVSDAVKSLETYTGDEDYVSIYTEPIKQAIRRYNATIEANNMGYIWISDLHINSLYPDRTKSLKRQLMACADLANRTNIKYIFIGGDIIDRETTYNTIYDLVNDLFAGVKESRRPTLVILGNHDDNPYTNPVPLSKSKTTALFVGMNNTPVSRSAMDKAYYYIDDEDYRIICLDSIDYPEGYSGSDWWSYSQTQVEWLAETLSNTNKKVIMLSHMTYDYTHQCYGLGNEGGYAQDIIDLMEAYNSNGTITLYGNTYNFTNNTGKILFWHGGHQHFDEQYTPTDNTVPILITSCAKNQDSSDFLTLVSGNTYTPNTESPWNSFGWECQFWTNRTVGTINEACIDMVSVGESTVHVIRLGAGVDRQFSI